MILFSWKTWSLKSIDWIFINFFLIIFRYYFPPPPPFIDDLIGFTLPSLLLLLIKFWKVLHLRTFIKLTFLFCLILQIFAKITSSAWNMIYFFANQCNPLLLINSIQDLLGLDYFFLEGHKINYLRLNLILFLLSMILLTAGLIILEFYFAKLFFRFIGLFIKFIDFGWACFLCQSSFSFHFPSLQYLFYWNFVVIRHIQSALNSNFEVY